jgi:hypothetical protein
VIFGLLKWFPEAAGVLRRNKAITVIQLKSDVANQENCCRNTTKNPQGVLKAVTACRKNNMVKKAVGKRC